MRVTDNFLAAQRTRGVGGVQEFNEPYFYLVAFPCHLRRGFRKRNNINYPDMGWLYRRKKKIAKEPYF